MKSLIEFKSKLDETMLKSSDYKIGPSGKKVRARNVKIGDIGVVRPKKDDDMNMSEARKISAQEQMPPIILVIKRKAVRLYPDGTRIALYYSSKLKKYFSVPFNTPKGKNAVIQSENFIENLSNVKELELSDGSIVDIEDINLTGIQNVFQELDENTKEAFINVLVESGKTFKDTYEFCRKYSKR